ncbi:16S rRNA (cytosine(1402)-N(4))-methyltransferase RsmH, partial [Candidatus Pacebacteria bacterium]|nr:16S rRNA (cytosine(1402)-N(4))-methyltransferase RsmH [Candidatus Paceibacterota bacterium]
MAHHISVLLKESVEALNPKDGGIYVDGTLGSGGHVKELVSRAKDLTVVGIDADQEAIERAKEVLKDLSASKFKLITVNSYNDRIAEILEEQEIDSVDGVLIDLGMSSDQIDTSGRGFTFLKDEPLLMTMDKKPEPGALTAERIVNEFTEEQIATIIFGYGEESFSRRLARVIVEAREKEPIKTTKQLADIISEAVPAFYRNGKRHPATKTFQALRTAVNDELAKLEDALAGAFEKLKPGGRLAVISFHSLEDRIVKRFMRAKADEDLALRITKKPIIPTDE